MWLYVLKLVENMWYVGKSVSPDERYKVHESGDGCPWTKRYPPVSMHEQYEISNNGFEEDCKVKELMKEHGISNVRGGSYCRMNLPKYTIKLLEREIRHSCDQCFTCGSPFHFAADCPKKHSTKNDLRCNFCEEFAILCGCEKKVIQVAVTPRDCKKKNIKRRQTNYQVFFDENKEIAAKKLNTRDLILITKFISAKWRLKKLGTLNDELLY